MTRLILVRHGQSQSNLERVFTGQGNTQLTELGRLQAQNTADYLKDRHIDRIYASDLSRAMDTAYPTAQDHGLEIIPRRELREIYAGEWEGNRYEDLILRYPNEYTCWLQDIGNACPNGGESVKELASRIYTEIDRILQENRGKCVAIFTHATPVRMMGCQWFGLPVERANEVPFCSNASLSIVEYEEDGTHRLICYGYDKHQGEHATAFPKKYV